MELWDVSNITDMSELFIDYDIDYTKIDICQWHVSNVNDMSEMIKRNIL